MLRRLPLAMFVSCMLASPLLADVKLPYSFKAENYKAVPAFDADSGVGFDIAPAKIAGEKDASAFVSETPFRFSVRVPEGNYRVRVKLANPESAGEVTVKSEQRRLMAHAVKIDPAMPATRTFLVNVRGPKIEGNDRDVKLDANREDGPSINWDDRLTLEFTGKNPGVSSITIEPVTNAITIYIAGDSTVTDGGNEPWTGWGQILPNFFKPTVCVANYAQSGKTLASFKGERRLSKVLSVIKPGDYLLIQFGHNDMKEKGDNVAFGVYKQRLQEYIAAAKEKGATPVLVTSMYRRRFDKDGKLQDSLGDFPAAMRQVASEQNVTLIDLHEMSGRLFQALGEEGTKKAFVFYPANTFPGQAEELKDNSHFSPYGGYELARCVAEAIRTSKLPLAAELSDDLAPFDPSKPDAPEAVQIPTSASGTLEKPAGS